MFSAIAKIFGMGPEQQPAMELQRLRSTALREKEYDITRPDLVNRGRTQARDSQAMGVLRKEDRKSVWSADMASRIYDRR